MADSITISKEAPDLLSMRYDFLREEGIKCIQDLAGKLWTDHNYHDPGITMLEVLCYAMTDLGFRTSYSIEDLIAQDPEELAIDIKNFFTACQILPNCALTYNDYRKLLIDVDVHDATDPDCENVGVKNAWLIKADEYSPEFYYHDSNNTLSYDSAGGELLMPKVLHNVLLEFGKCKSLGDLNESIQDADFVIEENPADPDIEGGVIKISIEFPRWDEEDIDWEDIDDIKAHINPINIKLKYREFPSDYVFSPHDVDENNNVELNGTKKVGFNEEPILGIEQIEADLNDFIYTEIIGNYQKKVLKVFKILDKVKATLNANRNLCEDFYQFQALKVEDILMCADIDLETDANVENVLAEIYHEIAKFLSPTVYFYSLDEMREKGYRTDQIFEGPKLEHGFIDDDELALADRKKVIRVSDLIQIIMDVEGVAAVRSIQIANDPQDNEDGTVTSKEVRWCLDLAYDENYVPRLNTIDSSITFFKDDLPFQANIEEVEELIEALEDKEREQKLHGTILDIPIPKGEFRDPEDYISIQEEFPLVYGIGEEGLPGNASENRRAQAKQMKGFLLFFDQLLADFLSQVSHVKELFSMNSEKKINGKLLIDHTYFTQSLVNIVPDGKQLYVDPDGHASDLSEIAESRALYETRRNKFLDHIMARFAEQFTDYAMLVYNLSGAKAAEDLIEDKLAVLNNYPEISATRGKAFNYADPCELWHINNSPGVEKRASILMGVDAREVSELYFGPNVVIEENTGDLFGFTIIGDSGNLITHPLGNTFDSEDDTKEALEIVIINAICSEKYVITDEDGNTYDYEELRDGSIAEDTGSSFTFKLVCDTGTIAVSSNSYATVDEVKSAIDELIAVCKDEYYNNPQSNRKNLSAPLFNYFEVSEVVPDMGVNPPTYSFYITLYAEPFNFGTGSEVLLTYKHEGQASEDDTEATTKAKGEAVIHEVLFSIVESGKDVNNYIFDCNPEDETGYEYTFTLTDQFCRPIGTGVATNFNDATADELNNPASKNVTVSGSTGNDGNYTVVLATADGANVIVEVEDETGVGPIPSSIADGNLSFSEEYTFTADKANYTFIVNADLLGKLYEGDIITIANSISNDGNYTVASVVKDGSETKVIVCEDIATDTVMAGDVFVYTKTFPIVQVNNGTGENAFVVKGGKDDRYIQDLAAFFNTIFFSREGLHLIEHTLLRPRYNGDVFSDATIETLNENVMETGNAPGTLSFTKSYAIEEIDSFNSAILIAGVDLTTDLSIGQEVKATKTSTGTYETYTVANVLLTTNGDTLVKVNETALLAANTDADTLSFSVSTNIVGINATELCIEVDNNGNNLEDILTRGDELEISGSEGGVNDAKYTLLEVTDNTGNISIIKIDQVFTLVQDSFLPVNVDDECNDCPVTNPYICIAHVVLPFWQGRFTNLDFRNFFDRTLRKEAPAHVFLNVCWIGCEQMSEFELKYKTWLLESSKKGKDPARISAALNDLIDMITRIRNVYPIGTLHDCESDDAIQNSIILGNSMLGNA